MLIIVYSISSQKWFNGIGFPFICCYINFIVKFSCQFLPFVESTVGINFYCRFLLLPWEINHISILIWAPIASNKKRTKIKLDCLSRVSESIFSDTIKINLDSLPNFLLKCHSFSNFICLLVAILINSTVCDADHNQKKGNQVNGSDMHFNHRYIK